MSSNSTHTLYDIWLVVHNTSRIVYKQDQLEKNVNFVFTLLWQTVFFFIYGFNLKDSPVKLVFTKYVRGSKFGFLSLAEFFHLLNFLR